MNMLLIKRWIVISAIQYAILNNFVVDAFNNNIISRPQRLFHIPSIAKRTVYTSRRVANRKRRHSSLYLPLLSSSNNSDGGQSVQTAAPNGEDTTSVSSQSDMLTLQKENKLLQERLKLLQTQNDQLIKQQQQQIDKVSTMDTNIEQRIILEDFEGEGSLKSNIIPTQQDNNNYDELGLSNGPNPESEDELCEYDDTSSKWTSSITGNECPVDGPSVTFFDAFKSRATWLVGLLALQSCSGFILSRNELLLQDHPVIIYFLTMLVGAGGNAGNQASVRVIRGLALGTLNQETQLQFLSRELKMAFALSSILSLAGFVRAIVFQTPFPETMAVTLALSMIVFSSICLGAILPLLLQKLGVDPAHSSTTIQVVMDILGVVLTVLVSTMVLDSSAGKMLIAALGKIGL